MTDSISSSVIKCLRKFNEFDEEILCLDTGKIEGLNVLDWQDELGRLRIWAANIGAHQIGQSSLDYRLRDSSHIRLQIVKLLGGIEERLHEARAVIAGNEGEDQDVESLGGDSSEDEESGTEIQQLGRSVATVINCLFQMSILVRKPAQHDLQIGSKKIDVAVFAPFDYRHVRDKFPRADEVLVTRLSHAITRRRKYLKYRDKHAAKLKQGLDRAIQGNDGDVTEVLSATVATDIQNWHVDFDDKASDSGISQTSYAPTLASGGAITIPPPPTASQDGGPFECPYCFYMITITNTRSWHRHVFNDLQPYVCTDASCAIPDKLYTNRHEWLQHLKNEHDHVEMAKSAISSQSQQRTCELCGEVQETIKRYNSHVARHLQELALWILPRSDEESDEDDIDNIPHSEDSDIPLSNTAFDRFPENLSNDRMAGNRELVESGSVTNSTSQSSPTPAWEARQQVEEDTGVRGGGPEGMWTEIKKDLVVKEAIQEMGYEYEEGYSFFYVMSNLNYEDIQRLVIISEKIREDRRLRLSRPEFGEKPLEIYHKEGKTRIPERLVNKRILEDLGYPFDEEKGTTVVGRALNRERIDELLRLSKELNEEDDWTRNKRVLLEMKKLQEQIKEELRTGNKANHNRESIDKILNKEKKQESPPNQGELVDPIRPTIIRVHRKHLSPVTLDTFKVPYEWDEGDSNYLIVKRWVPEQEQEQLFEHTRKLREYRRSSWTEQEQEEPSVRTRRASQ